MFYLDVLSSHYHVRLRNPLRVRDTYFFETKLVYKLEMCSVDSSTKGKLYTNTVDFRNLILLKQFILNYESGDQMYTYRYSL